MCRKQEELYLIYCYNTFITKLTITKLRTFYSCTIFHNLQNILGKYFSFQPLELHTQIQIKYTKGLVNYNLHSCVAVFYQ